MFAQRKILGLVTVLAVTGLLLVAASGVFAHHKSGHGGAGQGGGGTDTAEFTDADGDNFTSDGKGLYTNGTDGVSVYVDNVPRLRGDAAWSGGFRLDTGGRTHNGHATGNPRPHGRR